LITASAFFGSFSFIVSNLWFLSITLFSHTYVHFMLTIYTDMLKNLSKAIIRHQKSITMIKSNQKNHHLQYNVSKNRTLVFR